MDLVECDDDEANMMVLPCLRPQKLSDVLSSSLPTWS